MRSSGGTNFGLARSVVARTKSRIACFAGPSFHEPSALAGACACAAEGRRIWGNAGATVNAASSTRRLMPEDQRFGFMSNSV